MLINILTNNSCPNSRAFNFPLLASRKFFREKSVEFKFHWEIAEDILNCDILFINSNVFRPFWAENKENIFRFLENASKRNLKMLWFDTTDSTWCTQFEVMPFVAKFLKGQMLADREMYLQRFQTGRIYTDFFEKLYDSGEKPESYPLPSQGDLGKMAVSWNTCFENYTEKRFSLRGRVRHFLRPYLAKFADERIKVEWTAPSARRSVPLSCRVGTSHSRPSVADHRRAMMDKLAGRGVAAGKIPLLEYFRELRNSQIAASPFGVGEITLRDFEIIICGAALLKPDMNHLETWPELFVPEGPGKTFESHSWDLSNLDEKIDILLSNPEKRIQMAENAQKVYEKHLSEQGMQEFCQRLLTKIA